jgi:hypothetical protein
MVSEQDKTKERKSFFSKLGRWFVWILASFVFLILLFLIIIQASVVQDYARKKTVSYLEHKLKTKVEIGKLRIKFPITISLQNVFLGDKSKDTLLYGGEIKVNINMFRLLKGDIRIKEIALNHVVVKAKRLQPNSVFNYQFIVDAFASKQVVKSKDTTSLKMNINRILVDNTRINYKDVVTGNDMDLTFGHLDVKINTFDPSHLLFNIPSISLNGLKGYFYQREPLKESLVKLPPESSTPADQNLRLFSKALNLSAINVVYKNDPSHLNASFVIGKAQLHPKTIDLKNSAIDLRDAFLSNSNITIARASQPAVKVSKTTAVASPSFKIISGEITINNSNLKYDDQSAPHAASGMDYSHLALQQFSIHATKLLYSVDTMYASVKSASMKEKSGFVLNNLVTDFYMIPTGISLRNLLMITPGSVIRNKALITYASLEAIKKSPGELRLNIDLDNSRITKKDLLTFVPQLKVQLASIPANSTFFIATKMNGKLNDLNFQKLIVSGLTATNINVTGTIKGLPEIKKAVVDLNIFKFQSSNNDIRSFIPNDSLLSKITLPENIAASGHLKGGMDDLYADLAVTTSLGDAKIKGTLVHITDKNSAHYDLLMNASNLDLATILQNPKLGLLTGDFILKGDGYDPVTANATFSTTISTVTLNDYKYQHIKANGSIANKLYKINAGIHDPNLDVVIDADGSFNNIAGQGSLPSKYPTVHLKATIDSIKTVPLHFTTQPLSYHGQIDADFANVDPDNLAGKLIVTHSVLVNNGKRITIDSVNLIATNTPESKSLNLKSDFLTASIKGQYKLTQLSHVIQQSIDPYFLVSDKKDTVKVAPYHFTINAAAFKNPTLIALVPQLTQLKPCTLTGSFASDSAWTVSLKAPRVMYGAYAVDTLSFNATTKNGALIFNTSFRKFISGTSLSVFTTTFDGTLQNNKLDFALNIKDQKAKNKYTLNGLLSQPTKDSYSFSLKPDPLLLNYEKWTVNADNKIQYLDKDINAHDFVLSKDAQMLSVNSAGSGVNEPLHVDFKNFKISTLTGFVQNDSLLVNGLLNGNTVVLNIQKQPTFTADLTVSNLSVYKDTVGNLTAKVNNNIADTYHADVSLKGNGNDVKINGDYVVKPTNSSYDFVVDLVSLQMKSLASFSQGAIKDARGNLFGKIAINGSLEKPNINGQIHFNNTAFNVTKLNNLFKIDKDAIAIINNKGMALDKFSIHDTINNAIVIDGAINTPDFLNYDFNLKINADNFQAINSTKKDNKLFYGKMVFSTKLTVKGTPSHPIVDGDLTINDKTNFTVVLPQDEPGVAKREGIVRFVDMSATAQDSLFMLHYDSLKVSPLLGYDVSININIKKEAVFNLIVDEANGDFLKIKGIGQLTGGVDASGKVTLVGSYEIEDGSYDLSFNFVKRKFNIQKGSRIVWTGEPTSANMDITAIYLANTAPLDLVLAQVIVTDQNIYKQKLPFEVHLLLAGELLKPQITFDIILPEEKNYNVSKDIITTVQNKLIQLRQEQGEMNKQVFALLLLNRFVSENPFTNSSGSFDANTFARQSVSKLLTEQLNQLTQGLIAGVDINLDLANSQDYTTGTMQQRTDLNVGVSKNLLSDRLTVSVGSDFELEGPMQANQQKNNLAGNIALNYKLSKDGKYMLRVYRKNDYTGTIEGYVIETGVGFIISVDYNKFKDIFTSADQRKKKREINRKNSEITKSDSAKEAKEQTIIPPSENKTNEK